MKTTFIYTLCHPITKEVRYVGKANNIKQRLYSHIKEINKYSSHKNNWIKSLINEGLKPEITVLDEIPFDDWIYWEKYWITQFKQWGFNLTNLSEGGMGPIGVKHSVKTRAKMGKSRLGIPLTPEHKAKISQGLKDLIKRDPTYLDRTGFDRIPIDRDELYKKYITEDMSMPELAIYFNLSQKKIFSELHIYDIKKLDGWWLDGLSKKYKKIVLQYDLNGNLIREWDGIVDIVNELGYNSGNIASNCRGLNKSSSGYIWRYKDEWIELPNFDLSTSPNITRVIRQLDLENNIINIYSTITLAAKNNKLKSNNIKLCCEGKAKTYKKFKWEFI